ncbi:hypothetical protein BGZ61DRAFT_483735 [Ilyonectria robusta]|uniref:uncharacterized protein n=1 Tax=Ilyonectria robusta TaxID=1079257 RepID=UPI001E8E3C84|nr:uncharacterized protein BGZ61DRAFT_483735 [Ilyonectria robusta]KAH8667821.1 hypothetical protein BGZ61DRAFT_483735 [Ilyonectria robusta]
MNPLDEAKVVSDGHPREGDNQEYLDEVAAMVAVNSRQMRNLAAGFAPRRSARGTKRARSQVSPFSKPWPSGCLARSPWLTPWHLSPCPMRFYLTRQLKRLKADRSLFGSSASSPPFYCWFVEFEDADPGTEDDDDATFAGADADSASDR